jgi:hypothetical protein
VVAIVLILVAIAIPDITTGSRMAANEAAAMKALRAVQSSYYGSPIDCSRPRSSFGGTRSGYVHGCTGTAYWAIPEAVGRTGTRGFAADASGRICFTTDGTIPAMTRDCAVIR